jgi:HSP20 family protein
MDAIRQLEGRRYALPACAISEEEGIVTIRVEMPGVPRESLEVRIEGNGLAVAGERPAPAPKGKYILRERRAQAFRKLFTLDDSISREAVDASLENGVLVLKLRVKEAAKPRRIEIA